MEKTRLTEEPKTLLAVVEDDRGRQWYRWSAGVMHTSVPWAALGAVHGDTVANPEYECLRWEDLPPVFLVSIGVTRDSYRAEDPRLAAIESLADACEQNGQIASALMIRWTLDDGQRAVDERIIPALKRGGLKVLR